MFQRNQFVGGRPAGNTRLGQGIRMSTLSIVVRAAPKTTVARPTVYQDFYQPTLVPQDDPRHPPCEPGSPGCIG